jgi:hypothetical protein
MLLQESTTVELSPAVALRRLSRCLTAERLQSAARCAVDVGLAPLLGTHASTVGEDLAVQTVAAYPRGGTTVLPMRWSALGTPTQTPQAYLDANLELDQAPDGTTRLTLVGSYLPPRQLSDAPVSRSAVRQAAQATLTAFLLSLRQLLTSASPG